MAFIVLLNIFSYVLLFILVCEIDAAGTAWSKSMKTLNESNKWSAFDRKHWEEL